jgi:predicted ATPase
MFTGWPAPQAIELAASWIRVLSAQDILKQVEQSLDFLSSSEPTLARRHCSMRAGLDCSWWRLTGEQERVFATLSVFRGSFSREAAEAVADASLSPLAALAENSLLRRLPGGEGSTRYHLHEVVRQYAEDRLEVYGAGSGERFSAGIEKTPWGFWRIWPCRISQNLCCSTSRSYPCHLSQVL